MKEPTKHALNAACWLHPTERSKFPEYLHLGEKHMSESDITQWLAHDPPLKAVTWDGGSEPEPEPLPA